MTDFRQYRLDRFFCLLFSVIRQGPLAQLVMRRIRIAEITGSTPVRSTKLALILAINSI